MGQNDHRLAWFVEVDADTEIVQLVVTSATERGARMMASRYRRPSGCGWIIRDVFPIRFSHSWEVRRWPTKRRDEPVTADAAASDNEVIR